jgi:hypothetical protein
MSLMMWTRTSLFDQSATRIPHDGLILACEDGRVARVVWSVREGRHDQFDGPEIVNGYRSVHPIHEPKLGEVLRLQDGSAWRVVDWVLTDHVDSPGNVLVVERVRG